MKKPSFSVRIAIESCLSFAALLPLAAHAQTTYTWTGGGSDNDWSTGANWSGSVAPVRGSSTFVTFGGSTRTSPFNNQGDWQQLAGMTFAAGAGGFRIEGNNIGFVNGSGEQSINQNSATTQEINTTFSFSPNQNSRINLNAGDLVVSSQNLYIDSAASVRNFTVTGTDSTRRTVTFAGNVNKGGTATDPDMYVQANKRALVTGSLTFGTGNDGSIFVNDGVLQFSGAGGMTGGRPVIGAGSGSDSAALWLDTAGTTFTRQLELNNGSLRRTIGGLNTSGTVTFSGDFAGSAGNYDLAAAAGGTAVFSGTRNFNGGLFVNRPEGSTSYGGTVVLSNTTNSTEFTAIHAGTLPDHFDLLLGAAHLEFNADSGDSGAVRYTGGSTTTTKTLWIDNTGITRAAIDVSQAGATLTWNPGSGNVNTNLTKVGSGGLQYGGAITGSATVGLEAGVLIVTGSANTYSGGTVVSGGTLEVSGGGTQGGSTAALGTGSVSIAAGGRVAYWLSLSGAHTIANAFSLSGGTLHTTDGANTYSGQVTLASGTSTVSAQYEDTITLSGGLAGSGNVLFAQTGGTGPYNAPTFVLSGTGANTGTVRVDGTSNGSPTKLRLANVNALQGATLDLATADVGTVEFTVAGTNTYALGGLQGSRNLAIGGNSLSVGGNNQSTTYSGGLSGTGSVTKAGSGTLRLTGTNNTAAGTTVSAGTLQVDGSVAGPLTVAAAGTLSGTGSVGGNAAISGNHSPGNSPGIQTFGGDLTYAAGAVVNWELIANSAGSPGTNFDQISVGGNLSFAGSTTLALSFNAAGSNVDWANAFWNVNRSWMVYDLSTGTTGSLSNLVLGGSLLDSQGNALSSTTRGYFTTSLSGQDLMLNFTAVPEPSTLMMAGLAGLAGAVRCARRRIRAPGGR